MLRGLWTVLAVGLVLVVIALSMSMNFEFGYSLGTSERSARILGILSVAFDGLKALLPLFMAWQWRDRRRVAAGACGVLFILLAAYGLASVIGFASQNRETLTASRENLNASLSEHRTDLEAADKRLANLGVHRVAGVIEADVARLQKDRIWDATAGCTEATIPASREFCKRIDGLRAELALAAADHVLSNKIETLKFKIEQLRGRGAGQASDPQLSDIARAMSLDALRVRSGLNWLLAIAVESVSCFGLFAISRHRQARTAAEEAPGPADDGGRPWRLIVKEGVISPAQVLQLPARSAGASMGNS